MFGERLRSSSFLASMLAASFGSRISFGESESRSSSVSRLNVRPSTATLREAMVSLTSRLAEKDEAHRRNDGIENGSAV